MAKKILLVDDEPNITKLLSMRLKSSGYEVLTASDGAEGLEKARSQNPDLIILDLMMPKMEGYEVCRLLKFDEKYKHIPIIISSAKSTDEDRHLGEKVGADDYLSKPYDPEDLLQKINKYIGPAV